jgi:putative protease
MRKPELLAPGGSFQSAYYALEAGADGVYLGLTEFSARKAAANFTFDQLRRIRQLAAARGGKIYVTVNTIVRESELPRLGDALARLEAAAVDGVIVQDFGVLSFLRRHFPGMPVHASTQMAVHNSAGIRYLESLGVKRVILSRELTLERIRGLREAHPGMEIEVFIHGALCYGFSGICLASSALTGRSGNRGDCAQICRSLFSREPGEGGVEGAAEGFTEGFAKGSAEGFAKGFAMGSAEGSAEGFFFSCRDLCLGTHVLELAEAGVDAFKIEGRMKSPEYVFNTVSMYRAILDGGGGLPEPEYRELMRRSEVSYSREKTIGFFHSQSGAALIDRHYPGHRGAVLGTIGQTRGNEVSVRLESDLSIRDGLAFFPSSGNPFIFSVQRIHVSGRAVKFARKGETAVIHVPEGGIAQMAGKPVYQLSSRFLDLRQPTEASFPLWKSAVDLEVSLRRDGTGFLIAIEPIAGLPAFMSGGPFERKATLDSASQPRDFGGILKRLFGESGDSFFSLRRLSFTNATGLPDDGIFMPPSALKRVRKEFYADLESRFEAAVARKARDAAEYRGGENATEYRGGENATDVSWTGLRARDLGRRDSLSPRACAPVPFVCGEEIHAGGPTAGTQRGGVPPQASLPAPASGLPTRRSTAAGPWAGAVFLPLPPVILDDAPYLDALKRRISAAPEERFAVGLSNVSHLAFAEELAVYGNVRFFVDFPLYVANHWAFDFFSSVKKLLFQYFWIEGGAGDFASLADSLGPDAPLVRIDSGFHPPLFYALGCFSKHAVSASSCPPGCPRERTELLRQGGGRFLLHVRDCVTYLFLR